MTAPSRSVPLFVVNLDRSPERLAHMRAQLGGLGLEFHRIDAVDGNDLADEHAGPLSPGETACFLSHRLAWQRIAEGPDPYGVVFEDDVVVHPLFVKLMADTAWIPEDAEIVKLDTRWTRVHLGSRVGRVHGVELRQVLSPHFGCAGYVVRREAAVWLLEASEDIRLTVDQFVYLPDAHPDRQHMQSRAPRSYQCVPAPVVVSHRAFDRPVFESLLEAERAARCKDDRRGRKAARRYRVTRIFRELARPVWRFHRRVVLPAWAWIRGQRVIRVPYADAEAMRQALRARADSRLTSNA